MAEAKKEKWFLRAFRHLASAWISWVAFGAALATIGLATLGAVGHPAWMLSFLGIQEKVGESYPTISNQGNVQLAAEASNVFEKLGPVGDFFGGTVNPILTFISICLLLWSIKIQRDELREARIEMKLGNLHSEEMARNSEKNLNINRDSIRPFISIDSASVVDLQISMSDGFEEVYSAVIKGMNVGGSLARVLGVSIYIAIGEVTDGEEGKNLTEYKNYTAKKFKPVMKGEKFIFKIELQDEFGEYEDSFDLLSSFYLDKSMNRTARSDSYEYVYIKWEVGVFYEDLFAQKWSTNVTIITRGGGLTTKEISLTSRILSCQAQANRVWRVK
jgi:hypothetical protein